MTANEKTGGATAAPEGKMAEQIQELGHDYHPMDRLLRTDRLPHIWCSTCGIGPVGPLIPVI